MTQLSIPWPQAGPGDGRPYTDAEWRTIWLAAFNQEGVFLDYLNELTATVVAANSLSVNTGAAFVYGAFYHNSAAVALAPASAPGGTVRQCSIIIDQDHTGAGVGQYTARLAIKVGDAVNTPAMTQTPGVQWQMRLYNFQIDDAGAITSLTRVCYAPYYRTQVNLDMLLDGVLTANAAGRAKMADQFVNHAKIVVGERWIVGMIMPFSGAFGGAGSHHPIDPASGVADTNWHLCNGDVVGGVVTPDLRDRFIMGAGPTYVAGASGGAATKNLAHTHGPGTLNTDTEAAHTHTGPSHTHAAGTLTVPGPADSSLFVGAGVDVLVALSDHGHASVTGNTAAGGTGNTGAGGTGNTGSGGSHDHNVDAGATASGGSAAQDVLNPYFALSYIIRVANT